MTRYPIRRVLSIDPSTRSVAFALLDGPDCLSDWGTKSTGKADSARALEVIGALATRFQPQILAIEDCTARASRRCPRVRKLLHDLASIVPPSVTIRRIPIGRLALTCGNGLPQTKYERALALAKRFPELQPRLPRFRKPWMSEDVRVNVFDALALALACFPADRKVVDDETTSAA
jgi:hypothetical protein